MLERLSSTPSGLDSASSSDQRTWTPEQLKLSMWVLNKRMGMDCPLGSEQGKEKLEKLRGKVEKKGGTRDMFPDVEPTPAEIGALFATIVNVEPWKKVSEEGDYSWRRPEKRPPRPEYWLGPFFWDYRGRVKFPLLHDEAKALEHVSLETLQKFDLIRESGSMQSPPFLEERVSKLVGYKTSSLAAIKNLPPSAGAAAN